MSANKLTTQYSYLLEWVDKSFQSIRMRYTEDEIPDKEIYKYLHKQLEKKLQDKKIILVNNYQNKIFKLTILSLIEMIRKNNLICAGGGCLFFQHGVKRNILIEFIMYIMEGRKNAKKERKNYEKGTEEWDEWDRAQLAFKLIINSLYGCLGYPGFILFNIFLAEAITNQGRHIITSAINSIENFLGDNMQFESSNDILNVLYQMDTDFFRSTKGHLSEASISMISKHLDLSNLTNILTERYLNMCIFIYSQKFKDSLYKIFDNMSVDEKIYIYYKNNFMEFTKLPIITEKIKKLIIMNGPLSFCEMWCYKDDSCREIVKDIWNLYNFFVAYNHPIFDRIQKAMYLDKKRSLYTDTDSVFLSVNEIVVYIRDSVFPNTADSGMSAKDLRFTSANFGVTIVNNVIADTMSTFCTSLNITELFAKLLVLKNEFFMARIMFNVVKKRYISLSLLQEGQPLGKNGDGLPEIKGYDFKKSGVKPFVNKYYTDLCNDYILFPEKINPVTVFGKVVELKNMMEATIRNGNMDFYKQSNVKKPEYYKNPYSTQGVCAVTLWNALNPNNMLDYPVDVNIVPIKVMTFPAPPKKKDSADKEARFRAETRKPKDIKNIRVYSEKYPEAYSNLFSSIYCNQNALIRHINLSYIAIPKNLDYRLPEYITELFDIDSVINDTLRLILPILKALGINSLPVSSNLEYLSNMISL